MKNKLVIGILLIILILFLFIATHGSNMQMYNDTIQESLQDQQKIPLHIYQTWHTKHLSKKMKNCVEKLKKDNPEFEHHFYDIHECRTFIKENFDKEVLDAYDKLKPLAFKADLWRYCVLYKNGGVYLDIKYQCENGFKLINIVNSKLLVKEFWNGKFVENVVNNGFMISNMVLTKVM